MAVEIVVFGARTDNFGFLLRDGDSGRVAAVDAPEEAAILAELDRRGWTLDEIFITHHHNDHTEAIAPLKRRFGANVVGPRGDAEKIAGLDTLVGGGDTVMLGDTPLVVIDVPGHTPGHIAYHLPTEKALFAADALFSIGVGRMLPGMAEKMWEGLERLRALDPDTQIYCGHEYTLANGRFALGIEPGNEALKARIAEAEAQIAAGRPTIPSTLASELAVNPFLRADVPDVAAAVGMEGRAPWEVFGALRAAKDRF